MSQDDVTSFFKNVHFPTEQVNSDVLQECLLFINSCLKESRKNTNLSDYLDFISDDKALMSTHSVITALYSYIVAYEQGWLDPLGLKPLIKGALFHDYGKMLLPLELVTKDKNELTQDEIQTLKKHPELGYDHLASEKVSQQIKQVIYQHHEYIDGSGYPIGLTRFKIFPFAKIVSFASTMANLVVETKTGPLKALMNLANDGDHIHKFEPSVIKLFISHFQK